MLLTREADCAIRIMLEVASRRGDVPATTLAISRRRLVPRPFIRKIATRLAAAGLLRTRRGARGGLSLARPAESISLLEVIQAAHGPIAVNHCVHHPESCPLQPTCPAHEVCRIGQDLLVGLFGGIDLAELVRRGEDLQRGIGLRAARNGMAPDDQARAESAAPPRPGFPSPLTGPLPTLTDRSTGVA